MTRESTEPDIHFSDEDVVMATDTEPERQIESPPAQGRPRRSQVRISYAAQLGNVSDSDQDLEDDDESENFSPGRADEESDVEMDLPSSEDDLSAHRDAHSQDGVLSEDDMLVDDNELEVTTVEPPKKKQKKTG
jgi:hypothetical protein